MEERRSAAGSSKSRTAPELVVASWENPFAPGSGAAGALPDFLNSRRWFGGKAKRILSAGFADVMRAPRVDAFFTIAAVEYTGGERERYLLPLSLATGEDAARVEEQFPDSIFARLKGPGRSRGVLYEAVVEKAFAHELIRLIAGSRRIEGNRGTIMASQTHAFRKYVPHGSRPLEPRVQQAEQSNTSIIYGDKLILKMFRRLEPGVNPDLEIGYFLTEVVGFGNVPPVAGSIEYRFSEGEPVTLAVLHGFVANRGDAWGYTLGELKGYLDRVDPAAEPPGEYGCSALDLLDREAPAGTRVLIGDYFDSARLLGRRTAEMHRALSQESDDPAFAPEPFTDLYRQAMASHMIEQAGKTFALLREGLERVPEAARKDAQTVLSLQPEVRLRAAGLRGRPISAMRIRHHGDYHLGQVLYTGDDFVIIDFEGEPARPLAERRAKMSPLRDVAGMLRSFHYASQMAAAGRVALDRWAEFWNAWVSTAYLGEYLTAAAGAVFLPKTRAELEALLSVYLIEKAMYEVSYELNNRPDWVRVPLRGILQLMRGA